MCLDDIWLVGSWEGAAHSVKHVFSLYHDYCNFSYFGFEEETFVFIASIPLIAYLKLFILLGLAL